jgi:hypothetical protein
MVGMGADDLAYAIKISPHGAVLLCSAAGIEPPKWEDREWVEPIVQSQSWGLATRNLYEIISEDEIISRRPIRCAVCGGTFSIDEFMRLRDLSRRHRLPDPHETIQITHEKCPTD